jgi:DNA-binding NtrC family response regulator
LVDANEGIGWGKMIGLDAVAARLPVVLVVDPVAASRFTMWRLLSRYFGVLEAPDARRARDWLASRRGIDALIVQAELPDADGGAFVKSLVSSGVAVASRAILVKKTVDLRAVVTTLADWFFSRDGKKTMTLLRDAARLVS